VHQEAEGAIGEFWMRETKTGQQAAQLHECYMIMMMMMTTTMMMMTMNDRNELLELQSNVKFQTTKQAGGKKSVPVQIIRFVVWKEFT